MESARQPDCCTLIHLSPAQQSFANMVAVQENPKNAAAIVLGEEPNFSTNERPKSAPAIPGIGRIFPLDKKLWRTGSTLLVHFAFGSVALKDRVMKVAKEWENHANIKFEVTDDRRAAHIRVGFYAREGHYSYLGTDALTIPRSNITMNLDGLSITETTSDEEMNRVVLHEFGHALGVGHEHKRAAIEIPWDKPVVYQYYWDTQRWTRDDVDAQVFNRISEDQSSFGTDPDITSIMMYAIRQDHTVGDFEVAWNTQLSNLDKEGIGRAYP